MGWPIRISGGGSPTPPTSVSHEPSGFVTASTTGTVVAAGTSTPGSWVELVASTSFEYTLLTLWAGSVSTDGNFEFELGIGASGSEVVIAQNICATLANSYDQRICFPLPVNVPSGSRLAIRAACNLAGKTINVTAQGLSYNGYAEASGFSSIEAINTVSSNTGVVISAPGTANTWSSWIELKSSVSRNFSGFIPTFNLNSGTGVARVFVQIGSGAASSETALFQAFVSRGGFRGFEPRVMSPVFIPITSGARLAARIQCDGTGSSGALVVNLLGF